MINHSIREHSLIKLLWNDEIHALHLPEMDETHREFIELLARVQGAPDAELPRCLDRLLEHTRAHFTRESEMMEGCGLSSQAEHEAEQIKAETLGNGFYRIIIHYGFKDEPDIPKALQWCAPLGISFDPMATSFFLGRETLIPKLGSSMSQWREKLFIGMFRNAGSAASFFKIPPNRVVELGTQIIL